MVTERKVQETDRLLAKAYRNSATKIIEEFEATYNKLLNTIADDKNPTPADLYKLDKYWKMQGQIKVEAEKLGSKQIKALSKEFETNYFEVYHSINIDGLKAFSTIDKEGVQQVINSIWVADGKSWSSRIWDNTEKLLATLNEELISCVATGKTTSQLKKVLQERFNVSYSQADALARTELAHIQTQAAQQRYKDYGIEEFEVWADKDERRCEVCGKLHKKRYRADQTPPIPAHPRCRCCIVPVVD
jgi:SPP1 gp7 family putative phage head morphogenesis protein